VLTYDRLDHYSHPEFIAAYAQKHSAQLVNDREDILEEYRKIHQPPEFGEALRNDHPEIYERATWRVRALALAEVLLAEPAPPASTSEPEPQPGLSDLVAAQEEKDERNLALAEARIRKTISIRDILEKYPELDRVDQSRAVRLLQDALEGKLPK